VSVKRIGLFAAMAVALAAFIAVAGEGPIRLGAVNPLGDITGFQATRAMQLAVEEINAAGGVLGRMLELIVIDDEMSPAKGAAAIDLLATVHNVDVFIGGMASGVHLAQIPRLIIYQIPTVWIGAAWSGLEPLLAGQDWYFHIHPWDYLQVQSYVDGWAAIAERFPEVVIRKAYWAYEDGAFGTGSFAGVDIAFPHWQNIGRSFTSAAFGGGEYRALLRHAKAWNPDIFIWIGYAADALPILEQAREVGFTPPLFVGSPPGWPADFGKSPLAEGVVLYGMWAPSLKDVSPVSRHFWDAYVARWNEEPATYFAPLGWTNVYVVAEAIARAGTTEREALIAALAETKHDSPIGETLTFTPSRIIRHQGFRGQKILQWQSGRQEVIWPFEFATADIIFPFTWGR